MIINLLVGLRHHWRSDPCQIPAGQHGERDHIQFGFQQTVASPLAQRARAGERLVLAQPTPSFEDRFLALTARS